MFVLADVIVILTFAFKMCSVTRNCSFFPQSARDDLQRLNENLSGQIEKTESEVVRLKEYAQKREDDYQMAKKRAIHFKV